MGYTESLSHGLRAVAYPGEEFFNSQKRQLQTGLGNRL